jgi:hypothetical protein
MTANGDTMPIIRSDSHEASNASGLRMQSMRTEVLLDYLRVIYAGDLLNGKGPI